MPNLGVLLREEMTRLSRRTLRGGIAGTKRASAQQRRDIAALKRSLGELTRQVAQLARRMPQMGAMSTSGPRAKAVRFVAKGLRAQRTRLELSAADLGRLVGVSEQSVYNWEQGTARPRPEYAARMAALRNAGKREAHAQLAKLAAHAETVAGLSCCGGHVWVGRHDLNRALRVLMRDWPMPAEE